jgi:hypothetical protein
VPFHSIRQSCVTPIFFDPGFNLFSIYPIFWNFSKVQKNDVTVKLNEMVQYWKDTDLFEVC